MLANINENTLASYFDGIFILESVAIFIPELALSLVNLVVTSLISFFVTFEKWDYASTSIMNEIGRVYIA